MTVFPSIRVLVIEWMAVQAFRLLRVIGWYGVSSQDVLSMRNRLDVVGIHAAWLTTKMVWNQSLRKWNACLPFVRHPVGSPLERSEIEQSVTVYGCRAAPEPAFADRFDQQRKLEELCERCGIEKPKNNHLRERRIAS